MKYQKKTKPALWKQMQDESKPASYSQHEWLNGMPPAPKRRIRHTSTARAKQLREYRTRSQLFLKLNFNCLGCIARGFKFQSRATEIHHSRGRTGTLLNESKYWKPVCSDCHRWIHLHPEAARLAGLICEVGKWNSR